MYNRFELSYTEDLFFKILGNGNFNYHRTVEEADWTKEFEKATIVQVEPSKKRLNPLSSELSASLARTSKRAVLAALDR